MKTEFTIPKIEKDESNSLPFKVADEITRMRQRIVSMPDEINGLAQLLKSLDRLELAINNLGFELPILLNQLYDEGMTLKVRFVPSDNIDTDEKRITKVIKPQINLNGQLVQMGEVEVSIKK
jgi:hypothetical protein